MASVHQQPGRPYWFAAFTLSDGRRVFRSTRTKNKKQAKEIARAWEKAACLGRQGKLTPDAARAIIAAGVSDVFTASNGEALPGTTVKDWCTQWLAVKRVEVEETTYESYSAVIKRFLASIAGRAGRDLATVRSDDVAALRDRLARDLSRTSANMAVKILRVCFGAAVKRGLLTNSPASMVDTLKRRGEGKRRPFTVAEIQRVLSTCQDSEWRGVILFGLYTGQRLGDIARLTWRAFDPSENTVAMTTGKTGRRIILPVAKPLNDYLATIPAGDQPDALLFPRVGAVGKKTGKRRRTGALSNQFYDLLTDAGLVPPRPHTKQKNGRSAARQTGGLSFHCLRHTTTTLLKAAGVSDALAREIIGHESPAISQNYTHLTFRDLEPGISLLPDVMKLSPAEEV